jgi:hypothetical protein
MGKLCIIYSTFYTNEEHLQFLYDTFPCALFIRNDPFQTKLERKMAATWLLRCDIIASLHKSIRNSLEVAFDESGTKTMTFEGVLMRLYCDHVVAWGLL